jgi:hypothetical protein
MRATIQTVHGEEIAGEIVDNPGGIYARLDSICWLAIRQWHEDTRVIHCLRWEDVRSITTFDTIPEANDPSDDRPSSGDAPEESGQP